MGKRITRSQEYARHAYRRALAKAVRASSKGTEWRSVDGCLFRKHDGWFISVCPAVYIFDEVTKIQTFVKPMSIDPIFWDLVGLNENNAQPLSFRLNGAWTCRPPAFAEIEVAEDVDANVVAKRMLHIANAQLDAVREHFSAEAFLAICQAGNSERGAYLPCVVTTLITLGRQGDALTACEQASIKSHGGGFLMPEGSFTQVSERWLKSWMAGRHWE